MRNVTGVARKDHRSPTLKSTLICSGAVFLVTVGLFSLLWAKYIKPYFFPYGDSFSLLVNSTPPFHPIYSAWFLHGFQTYFDVYPDMSLHATNFIRPGVNGTFWLEWFAFGSHWGRYLLTTYAIIGLISGATCFMASYILKLGWRLTLLATICVSIAPSIDTGAILDPTFAFDLLAGLFVLVGAAALVSDALIPAWVCLTLAIFTKETALFAPALAAVIVFLRKDHERMPLRLALCASFLLPLAAWLTLRWCDFHGEKGVYVLMDGSSHGVVHVILVRIILGLTTWPIAATVFWKKTPLTLEILQKASLGINVCFWIVLALIAARKLLRNGVHIAAISELRRATQETYSAIVLSVFCMASLLIPLGLNVPRRFGGVFYPLFILCMAFAAGHTRSRSLRVASATMMAAVAIAGGLLISADVRYQIPNLKPTWAMSRAYVSELSASHEPVIFIVDDLSGRYASNQYVQRFSGYQGNIVRVNDLQWDFRCGSAPQIAVDQEAGGGLSITSLVSKQCGDHAFNSVFPPMDPKVASFTRTLPNVTMRYELGRQTDPSHPNSGINKMQVDLQPMMAGSAVLFPDLSRLDYRKVSLESVGGTPRIVEVQEGTRNR
jgi:hypothetical protein